MPACSFAPSCALHTHCAQLVPVCTLVLVTFMCAHLYSLHVLACFLLAPTCALCAYLCPLQLLVQFYSANVNKVGRSDRMKFSTRLGSEHSKNYLGSLTYQTDFLNLSGCKIVVRHKIISLFY